MIWPRGTGIAGCLLGIQSYIKCREALLWYFNSTFRWLWKSKPQQHYEALVWKPPQSAITLLTKPKNEKQDSSISLYCGSHISKKIKEKKMLWKFTRVYVHLCQRWRWASEGRHMYLKIGIRASAWSSGTKSLPKGGILCQQCKICHCSVSKMHCICQTSGHCILELTTETKNQLEGLAKVNPV